MAGVWQKAKGFLFDQQGQQVSMEPVMEEVVKAAPVKDVVEKESSRQMAAVEGSGSKYKQSNDNRHVGYYTPMEYPEIVHICSVVRGVREGDGKHVVINFQRVQDEKTKHAMVQYLIGYCDACDIVLEEWEADWISVHPKNKRMSRVD